MALSKALEQRKSSGHVGVAVGPNSAHVGSSQFPRVTGDLNYLERSVAPEVRLPGFRAAVANILVPAGGLAFARHLKIFHAHDVSRMVRAHREFGPAVNAPSEIHQPRAVRKRDTHRLEFGLFVFSRRHLREQVIIGPVHHGGGSPAGIVEANRLPAGGFPARIKLNGRAIARSTGAAKIRCIGFDERSVGQDLPGFDRFQSSKMNRRDTQAALPAKRPVWH